jgi:hypothetical protein
MKAPIAVIIFNRPDHAARLRECLRNEEDRDLLVISDGPRPSKLGELEQVEACRKFFSDWPGRVHINFARNNLGCRVRVTSGLTWVFEHTDRAIILEDDCLPHPDFFRYADELLDRYENDTRIMSICGTNIFSDRNLFSWSYCFSKYQNCWGWATWKRSWALFDHNLSGLQLAKETGLLREHLGSRRAAMYWHYMLGKVRDGRIDSWAYIWTFTGFLNHGLHIIPKYNLIENSGFGYDSTHTSETPAYISNKMKSMDFPLSHPPIVIPHPLYDQTTEDTVFSKSIYQRTLWLLRKILFTACNP